MACFRIAGEFIADMARTRVIEGAYDHAIAILQDLEGITLDQIVSILKGEKTLIGDSSTGINLVDMDQTSEDFQEYSEQLEYCFGSLFCFNNIYWKPYARVTGPWDEKDMYFADKYGNEITPHLYGSGLHNNSKTSGAYYRVLTTVKRSMYYADNYKEDMLCAFYDGPELVEILCKKVDKPPFWIRNNAFDPETHLKECYLNNTLRLEHRGAAEATNLNEYRDVAHEKQQQFEEKVEQMRQVEYYQDTDGHDEDVLSAQMETIGELYHALANVYNVESTEHNRLLNNYERLIDAHYRRISNEQWILIEEARGYIQQIKIEHYTILVRNQADEKGGYITLNLVDKNDQPFNPPQIQVPRNPFIRWALNHFNYADYDKEAPEWDCIAPSGFKMSNDNPFHTDFLLGAGCDPTEAYDDQQSLASVIMDAAWTIRHDIVKEWTNVDFSYLSKADDERLFFTGSVFHAKPNEPVPSGCIAICKNASIDYQQVLNSINETERGIIICEVGGKLAHLAIVGRERNVTILVVPDALKKYNVNDLLHIDFSNQVIPTVVL